MTETTTVAVTGKLLDELKALVPGQVYWLVGKDGREYAIVDWADFEYIAEKAGMKTTKPVT